MADFPGKVNTQTSSPAAHRSVGIMPIGVDTAFIRSIPGLLLLAEIFSGLLVWALIASVGFYTAIPAYGWVMFVSVTLWILSVVLYVVLILNLLERIPSVPWLLVLLVFNIVASVLYITAFLADAVSVIGAALGASAFFAIVTTLLYTASSFFAYLMWRDDGQNAAGTTVPV